ncbi:MAG: type II secretion system protein [Fimbriimonas sp.]|nr:type II secretion system protein [Fimbriimonas sp.]
MKQERGNTLAGTLITIALMAILAVALFKGSGAFGGKGVTPRKDGKGTTIMGQVKYDAKDAVCQSNLAQVRQALIISQTNNDDKYPDTLEETKLGSDFYKCPIGGEKYRYDPTTGKVTCPHPGHESY